MTLERYFLLFISLCSQKAHSKQNFRNYELGLLVDLKMEALKNECSKNENFTPDFDDDAFQII